MRLWLSKFRINAGIFAVGLIILGLLLIGLNTVNHGLFITGFSATSLEMILILAFQVIYGYVYFMMGIFISLFMAGLMAGSLFIIRRVKVNYRAFSGVQYLIGIAAVLLPLMIIQMRDQNPGNLIVHVIFSLFVIIIGLMTGVQFALGSKLRSEGIAVVASGTYGADSLGSSIGALITVVYLVPKFGLVKVCLIIGILNFLTGLYILLIKRKREALI
jgi:spermidine synthase